ncbi:MAG TPA: PP2C family protein-serine/threonine phosphatase [Saprospiraceae bacterium]|nr:PP2C family protein-serine/threonine phosphatase [Saprospiraceae bacterium]
MEEEKIDLVKFDLADLGSYEFQGKRYSMEDALLVTTIDLKNQTCVLFGVFDGHGGGSTSKIASNTIKKEILDAFANFKGPLSDTNLKLGITNAFLKLESSLDKTVHYQQGSTANLCIVMKDRYICANLGDSRSVLCRDGLALPLSTDHKPNEDIESKRIYNAGEYVSNRDGVYRVSGILSVSRAFGDFDHDKHGLSLIDQPVTACPDVKVILKEEGDTFIITACDGLWDVYSNESAVQFVKNMLKLRIPADTAAERLVHSAYQKGSEDNISCIIVYL